MQILILFISRLRSSYHSWGINTQILTNGPAFHKIVFDFSELRNKSAWTQKWYANNSSFQSDLELILLCLQLLVNEGLQYSHCQSPEKSYLVVHPNLVEKAQTFFVYFKVNGCY